ncbi:MAG: hypothetical protein KZQ86_07725, partial [Candidatus Thiodiazotropha sp. (ex Lucinoma kastoroae)]|nr:hypothetical protein [Candidatus Thiodiazotropha sp. (ex Lucinoma kastoroae)]
MGIPRSLTLDEALEDPWTLPPSGRQKEQRIADDLPDVIRIVLSNQVFLEKEALSPPQALQVSMSILNTRFRRCAQFIEARGCAG